jgi:hypothetical protein
MFHGRVLSWLRQDWSRSRGFGGIADVLSFTFANVINLANSYQHSTAIIEIVEVISTID